MKTFLAITFATALVLGTARLALAEEPGRASAGEKAQTNKDKSGTSPGDMGSMPGMGGMQDHMSGSQGGMMGGMGCCSQMSSSDVTVEDTPDGAVLRFKAKDRADVPRVRRMAHMMENCMESGGAQTDKQQK